MGEQRPIAAVAVLAAFLVCVAAPVHAVQGTASSANVWRLDSAFFRQAGSDFENILTSPGRWGRSDWTAFAAVAGAGALLFAFDRGIFDWVQDRKTAASMDASSVISKFGNGGYLAGLMAALYVSGEIWDERSLRRTALLSLESFVATSSLVWAGKIIAGRARPFTGEGPGRFHPLSIENGHHSLPSGDAAGAFAVASVIAAESEVFWVDAVAYGLAGLAAVWRVHDRKHWPSDVFLGSALGYVVGRKVASLHRQNDEALHVSLEADPHRQALTLRFSF
jgi:membrane-associated phospholipid phosphatase